MKTPNRSEDEKLQVASLRAELRSVRKTAASAAFRDDKRQQRLFFADASRIVAKLASLGVTVKGGLVG